MDFSIGTSGLPDPLTGSVRTATIETPDALTFAQLEFHDRTATNCPRKHESVHSNRKPFLTNDVHPIFQGTHFDNDSFLPARRLASRLLRTDCLLTYWWALLVRKGLSYDVASWRGGKSDIPVLTAPPCGLTWEQVGRTKKALLELEPYVTFRVGNKESGTRTVEICPSEMQDFHNLMGKDVVAQAIASLTLGFTLARELGHAAFVAANTPSACQKSVLFCFDANRGDQDQLMLQSLVFGGTLRKEQDETSDAYYTVDGITGVPGLWLVLSDFPSASFSQTHTFYPGWDGIDEELITCHHREWQIPFWWAVKMMNDDVWETGAAEQGRKALRAPREVGFLMKRSKQTKWGPVHGSMNVADGLVPSGFKMVPRSYYIVANSLWNEFAGSLLYDGPDSYPESCFEEFTAASLKGLYRIFVDDESDTHSNDGMSSACDCSGIPCEDRSDEANAWSEDDKPKVWTVSRNEGGFYDTRGTFSEEMLLAAHDVASDGSLDDTWTDTSSEEDPLNDLERVVAGEVGDEASDDGYHLEELVAAEEVDEETSDDVDHSEELIGATDEQGDGESSDEEDPLDDLNRIASGEADSDSERGDTPMDEGDQDGVTSEEEDRGSAEETPVHVARRLPNRVNGHK